MPKEFVAGSGQTVVLTDARAAHMLAHPEAGALLAEAIGKVMLPERGFYDCTVDMGRVVGKCPCVPAVDPSDLRFVVRPGRHEPSRVLPGQEPVDTSTFVVAAIHRAGSGWELVTGYVGIQAPREPTSPYFYDKRGSDEFRRSVKFWSLNGLCMEPGWGEPYKSTWEQVLREVDAQRAAT